MKIAYTLFACAAIFASAAAKLTTIPTDVRLIYPTVKVNKNRLVTLGWGHNGEPKFHGLVQNISMSLTYPNGTNPGNVITEFGEQSACSPFPGSGSTFTGDMWVNDTGLYTVFWNYTYGTSPDPSQISDTSPCGPEPYSFESIIMNATFEVADLGVVFNPEQTHTTRLPTVPTGKVQSGASTSSEMVLLFVGSATLAIVAMLA